LPKTVVVDEVPVDDEDDEVDEADVVEPLPLRPVDAVVLEEDGVESVGCSKSPVSLPPLLPPLLPLLEKASRAVSE
jgi:hypothetical protein